jgi:hypothetical protein
MRHKLFSQLYLGYNFWTYTVYPGTVELHASVSRAQLADVFIRTTEQIVSRAQLADVFIRTTEQIVSRAQLADVFIRTTEQIVSRAQLADVFIRTTEQIKFRRLRPRTELSRSGLRGQSVTANVRPQGDKYYISHSSIPP